MHSDPIDEYEEVHDDDDDMWRTNVEKNLRFNGDFYFKKLNS